MRNQTHTPKKIEQSAVPQTDERSSRAFVRLYTSLGGDRSNHVEHGILKIVNGTVVYQPNPDCSRKIDLTAELARGVPDFVKFGKGEDTAAYRNKVYPKDGFRFLENIVEAWQSSQSPIGSIEYIEQSGTTADLSKMNSSLPRNKNTHE